MVADDLFQLPLDEFTAARNSLATKLKKAGKPDEAEQVRAISKPPVSAWVVNQLYWRHRNAFDRLMASSEKFRKAQAAQLSGKNADLRGTLDARREALSELSRLAAAVLRDAGHPAGPDMMRRVTTTLEAVATYGDHPEAPRAGRLTADVDPPGFEALAALVPQVGRSSDRHTDPRVLPFRQQAKKGARKAKKETPEEAAHREEEERKMRHAAAKTAVEEAEKALEAARNTAEQAESALKKAAAAAKEAEKERADLEQQFEKASLAADKARTEARRVASDAEEAAQAVEDAERQLDAAKRLLSDTHLA